MPKRPESSSVSRREALITLGAAAVTGAGASLGAPLGRPLGAQPRDVATAHVADTFSPEAVRAGRLNQSVARWCFSRMTIVELCGAARSIGLVGIDLLGEDEWSVPKQFGLTCTMGNSFGTIPLGFNRLNQHDKLVADGEAMIPKAAAAGVQKIVVFSGNRGGMSDGEGIANCITGLTRVMPTAEKHGVMLCMEMLNSTVDHKDYHADHTAWAVEVAKGVNSPNFRLLYDIYHMQVMEGNVIATISANMPWIGHFHTAGVPGRNEIDGGQELNYRGIAGFIASTGYRGVFAHEFLPKREGMVSLQEAVVLCTV